MKTIIKSAIVSSLIAVIAATAAQAAPDRTKNQIFDNTDKSISSIWARAEARAR